MIHTFDRPYELVTLDRYPGLGNIIFSERHFPSGHSIAVHWHDYTEVEIVLSGSLAHVINNERQTLTVGSAYIVSSCDFHGLTALDDLTILNLSFTRGSLDSRLEENLGCGIGRVRCQLDDLSEVKSIFSRAAVEYSKDMFDNPPDLVNQIAGLRRQFDTLRSGYRTCLKRDGYSALKLKALAEELLILLFRASGCEITGTAPLIQRAVALVNDRFRQPLTLNQAARSLFVSPNYLGARFSKALGMSFNRYLALTRLRFACGLLSSSDKPVKEIAFESGFGSVEYFLATFRKYLDTTPSEWRNKATL